MGIKSTDTKPKEGVSLPKTPIFKNSDLLKRPSMFSRGGGFGGKQNKPQFKFNPSQFKTQHKGGS